LLALLDVQRFPALLNLLRNAADAMSEVNDRRREMVIRTEREAGHRVRLSVRDAGSGIESGNLDKVFDAFYTTKNTGMGIGLSISRSIIEAHDGHLWAAANDGPGGTFRFSIPQSSQGPTGGTPTARARSSLTP
jgi:signal transduction histidine kinase